VYLTIPDDLRSLVSDIHQSKRVLDVLMTDLATLSQEIGSVEMMQSEISSLRKEIIKLDGESTSKCEKILNAMEDNTKRTDREKEERERVLQECYDQHSEAYD